MTVNIDYVVVILTGIEMLVWIFIEEGRQVVLLMLHLFASTLYGEVHTDLGDLEYM